MNGFPSFCIKSFSRYRPRAYIGLHVSHLSLTALYLDSSNVTPTMTRAFIETAIDETRLIKVARSGLSAPICSGEPAQLGHCATEIGNLELVTGNSDRLLSVE